MCSVFMAFTRFALVFAALMFLAWNNEFIASGRSVCSHKHTSSHCMVSAYGWRHMTDFENVHYSLRT
jgi:hypothetical protein